jgi:hypothetical protein
MTEMNRIKHKKVKVKTQNIVCQSINTEIFLVRCWQLNWKESHRLVGPYVRVCTVPTYPPRSLDKKCLCNFYLWYICVLRVILSSLFLTRYRSIVGTCYPKLVLENLLKQKGRTQEEGSVGCTTTQLTK